MCRSGDSGDRFVSFRRGKVIEFGGYDDSDGRTAAIGSPSVSKGWTPGSSTTALGPAFQGQDHVHGIEQEPRRAADHRYDASERAPWARRCSSRTRRSRCGGITSPLRQHIIICTARRSAASAAPISQARQIARRAAPYQPARKTRPSRLVTSFIADAGLSLQPRRKITFLLPASQHVAKRSLP